MIPIIAENTKLITLTNGSNTNGTSIAFFDDVYGRDKARLAQLQAGSGAVATAAK